MKWRSSIPLLLIFAPFLILWGVVTVFYSTDGKIKASFSEWSLGNFKEAEKKLESLSAQSPFEFNLYKTYIHRSKGEFDAAVCSLDKACLHYERTNLNSPYKEELVLNKILNDISTKNEARLKTTLMLHASEVNGAAYEFLQGLKAYVNQEYSFAHQYFETCHFLPDASEKHRGFLTKAWKETFTPLWKEIVLADCECQMGLYSSVKRRLEPFTVINTQQHSEKIHFILALSSLYESCELNGELRKATLDSARFYLSQVSTAYKSEEMKYALYSAFEKELEKPQEENIDFLLSALHDWRGDRLLKECAESLVKNLDCQHEKKPFLLWLRQRFPKNIFTKLIEDQLTVRLADSLHFESLQHFRELYEFVLKFHSDPKSVLDTTSIQLKQLSFDAIFKDDSTLPRTLTYLSHWVNLDLPLEEKQELSLEIVKTAEKLWLKEGQETKATTLMEVALYISEESNYGYLHRRMEDFLTSLYHKSQRCNTLKRLSSIYDAFDRLHLLSENLVNSINLENHLADAEYLFNIHRFDEAQAHAEWILKWDPQNQSALKLYGLTCYYQGEYFRAFHALTCLTQPDEQAQNALQLSQLMQFQEEGSLVTIDP